MPRSYEIHTIFGFCPVQAEGRISGKTSFYFRARGNRWSIEITQKRNNEPDTLWFYEEKYQEEVPFAAGWMEIDEAKAFIDKSIKMYLEQFK